MNKTNIQVNLKDESQQSSQLHKEVKEVENTLVEFETDKSSSSLFKHKISSNVSSRLKELPEKFYHSTIDDFRRNAISSETTESVTTQNNLSECSSGNSSRRLPARTRFVLRKKTPDSSDDSMKDNMKKGKSNESLLQRSLDREAIAEMNRQYDHNVCLDRFINEMEQARNEDEISTEEEIQSIEMQENIANRNSSPTDNCSNCSNSSSGCQWCNNNTSGSSSVAPRSSGTESGDSRKSDSLKSSDKSSDKTSDEPNTDATAETANYQAPSLPLATKDSSDSGVGVSSTSLESLRAANSSGKNYKGGKPGRKRKREYIYNPKPVKEKKSKMTVPEHSKTQDYWKKRHRNNEAAKRSRELRRKKELETRERFAQLRNENETLRKAIASLLKRNKTIDLILAEYEKSMNKNAFSAAEVVVSG